MRAGHRGLEAATRPGPEARMREAQASEPGRPAAPSGGRERWVSCWLAFAPFTAFTLVDVSPPPPRAPAARCWHPAASGRLAAPRAPVKSRKSPPTVRL